MSERQDCPLTPLPLPFPYMVSSAIKPNLFSMYFHAVLIIKGIKDELPECF